MFNPYRHLRTAGCVVLFLAVYMGMTSLLMLGFILVATGVVGGIDLAERRVELLEKILLEERNNEKDETHTDN